jgi:Copper transport outer membrane protein, MctB
MFDLRYHVASLAAVFLALIIGILVGVGISDRGLVDDFKTRLLQRQVADLREQLDQSSQQSTDRKREQQAARTFINETYPVLVRNRLRGKQIAVIFVGSADGAMRAAVRGALTDAGAQQLRLRAVKVPVDPRQLDTAMAAQPAAIGLLGKNRLEDLGHALGREVMVGGETPLWNSLNDALVEERAGGSRAPADGVVVVRTVPPQRDGTSRFLLGLYSGLASAGPPAVGVEPTDALNSATEIFRQSGLSTVDDIDTPVGRLALVLLLAGAPSGQYGVKDSAGGGALPPLKTPATAGG